MDMSDECRLGKLFFFFERIHALHQVQNERSKGGNVTSFDDFAADGF